MAKYVYGVIIRPSEDGGYWAMVPDLDGCYGQGSTFIETVESISNGIETHLAAMIECGMKIPHASRVETDEGEVVYVYVKAEPNILGEPFVSAAEAARQLSITPGRVSQLIAAGKIRAVRSIEGTSVAVSSIQEYAVSSRTAGRPKKVI